MTASLPIPSATASAWSPTAAWGAGGVILLVLAMTTGPRPHERVGGLRANEIAKFDGQR